MGRARCDEDRTAGIGCAQQRIEGADEAVIGRHVDGHHLVPDRLVDMGDRREFAEHARIAEQDIELAPALVDRGAEPVDRVEILDVHRHQCGRRSLGANLVVEGFERALCTGQSHDVSASFRKREGGRAADAARCAGDDRDAVQEWLGHEI